MRWREDPNIKAALKERSPEDVMTMRCPECGEDSYYNQGSHFMCYFCDRLYYAANEDELDAGMDGPFVLCEDACTVADLMDLDVINEFLP